MTDVSHRAATKPHQAAEEHPPSEATEKAVTVSAYAICIAISVLLVWPLLLYYIR